VEGLSSWSMLPRGGSLTSCSGDNPECWVQCLCYADDYLCNMGCRWFGRVVLYLQSEWWYIKMAFSKEVLGEHDDMEESCNGALRFQHL
jgi:hypothetical protein